MISPINPQRITPTRSHNSKAMFLLFGYGIIVSILTLLMMLGLFGDSTTSKKDNTLPQSMQRNLAK
jgi:hypothetical protein